MLQTRSQAFSLSILETIIADEKAKFKTEIQNQE